MTAATRTSRKRWGAVPLAVAAVTGLVLALLLAAPAGAASAQTPTTACDPTYGCTTTTPPPTSTITCNAQITGTAGGPQTAIITNAPPNVEARVVFNGNPIATGQTDAHGEATVAFQLPMSVQGSYQVLVAGVGFNVACGAAMHWDGGVGGVNQGQGNGGIGHNGSGTGSGAGGLLAFTGFHLLLWVLIAAALVAIGESLRRVARSRRRYT